MNLPPMPDLTITLSQKFEITKIMKECERADKDQLLLVIESNLQQMAMFKNTISKLIREWPNGQDQP